MMGRGIRVARRRRMVGTAMGVAATASMVSNARRNRAERKAIEGQSDMQDQADMQPEAAEPTDDLTSQLQQLNSLKNQGIITQAEFEAKKKQVLNI